MSNVLIPIPLFSTKNVKKTDRWHGVKTDKYIPSSVTLTLHVHIGHSALYLNQTNEFQSILDISWSGHAVAVLRVQAQSFTNVDLRYHSPVDHWSLSNIKP